MKTDATKLFFGLFLTMGLLTSLAFADLGLADMSASEAGAAVKAAAEAIYAGTDDPEQLQSQLIAILNEAEATGDEGAMRYAIVAVLMAGGAENLDSAKEAINNSNLFANHPEITAFTVAATAKLIGAGGGSGQGGAGQAGGGEEDPALGGGEEDPTSLGGGDPDPFDPGSAIAPYGKIEDRDSAATRI